MLTVTDLNVYYGDIRTLWDISFHVPVGKIVALVGSNGAGKTTALRALSNLIKVRSGKIVIDGQNTTALPGYRIAEMGVAHVPEGRQLFPLMTVYENLRIGSITPAAKSKREETLEEVFELFPILRDRRNQIAQTLSGGQQQMLAIGRGLMMRPKLILLDEPSLGLSPLVVSQIFETIQTINQKGITVLLVEQNVQRTLEMADYAYILENGRVAIEGKGGELVCDEHVRKAYLGI